MTAALVKKTWHLTPWHSSAATLGKVEQHRAQPLARTLFGEKSHTASWSGSGTRLQTPLKDSQGVAHGMCGDVMQERAALSDDAVAPEGIGQTKLSLDSNGSLVPLEPGSWLVCFVPGLDKQWWHPFVHRIHKHVFALRPAEGANWIVFEPWWTRLLTATIPPGVARKFLLWGAMGDVLLVREAVPGHSSQVRGWMTCAALANYLLGRPYWVWKPHGLYRLLLREPNVCRVDVPGLLNHFARLGATASRVIVPCDLCRPDASKQCEGAAKPFCMNCGRDL